MHRTINSHWLAVVRSSCWPPHLTLEYIDMATTTGMLGTVAFSSLARRDYLPCLVITQTENSVL